MFGDLQVKWTPAENVRGLAHIEIWEGVNTILIKRAVTGTMSTDAAKELARLVNKEEREMPLVVSREEFEAIRSVSVKLTGLVASIGAGEATEVALLCLARPEFVRPDSDMLCDRKKGHPGKHVWELGDEIGRLSVGERREKAAWLIPASQIAEMRRWLESPSGTYYPLVPGSHNSTGLAFEAALHGDVRIRASL